MKPSPDLVGVVRRVYPLIVNRADARVPLLALAHQRLTDFRGEEWADMALRVMLEYERQSDHARFPADAFAQGLDGRD